MKKSVLGIDIGGSKIRVVWWNGKRVIKAREVKTPKNLGGFKKTLRNLVLIAVPGPAKGAVFISAANISYIKNLNFKPLFPAARIKIDHDARCFAQAEYKNTQRTLFLTLGTGVGRAVGKNGKILKIRKFEYPEQWEKKYQKIRDGRDYRALIDFLAEQLSRTVKIYKIRRVIVGGGVSKRKNFTAKFAKALGVRHTKSVFGKNAVAVGAAMLF
ncbi:MAG: hypothetical protein UX18_C0007G0013 [Candidatus Azambacteria bacterium GW2011_GWC2_45_7b]|uniref:ROK family protein n=1 Tax=Candidatus Azambacteria bacterium GW2011_GWC2_45_7b TaxID=1618621 RepID=A0A837INH6_9BACT|nr:MAG: hypothetical protein UX18_C0007G0013 [Candidatus Azambacteria bacterium GW2011_GWC2_45_7b]